MPAIGRRHRMSAPPSFVHSRPDASGADVDEDGDVGDYWRRVALDPRSPRGYTQNSLDSGPCWEDVRPISLLDVTVAARPPLQIAH